MKSQISVNDNLTLVFSSSLKKTQHSKLIHPHLHKLQLKKVKRNLLVQRRFSINLFSLVGLLIGKWYGFVTRNVAPV